ncbi:putatie vesicle transport V-snare protein [Pseudoloma neurophilia]|uniref:Putatie vesicle transport V-snare protein n=1 Tax=Pseudoloma neurophilia TaxID=146866 RepID=A0A0R0M3L9_9MICR|nr:putatie vesicle transport V-snare protein [Pseudoloma neurophilia]
MRIYLSIVCLITIVTCLAHNYMLGYGEKETYYEQLEDNDTQLTVELSITLPARAALKYRILKPGSNTPQSYLDVPDKMVPLRFTGKGSYGIEVFNFEKEPVLFSVNTFIDKDIEPDENTIYIRNVLEKMKGDLRNLYNGSMQLSQDKRHVLSQARSSKTRLIWLCVLPFGYVLVGIVKYKMMKNMFMPKKRK